MFCSYWNSHKVEEVNCMLPINTRPQTSWNQKPDDADSHLPHHQPIRRMSMNYSRPPLWTITMRLLTTPSRAGHSLTGISLPWLPLPSKAIKQFFSTSPKTLSPHFCSAPVNRGWISTTCPTHYPSGPRPEASLPFSPPSRVSLLTLSGMSWVLGWTCGRNRRPYICLFCWRRVRLGSSLTLSAGAAVSEVSPRSVGVGLGCQSVNSLYHVSSKHRGLVQHELNSFNSFIRLHHRQLCFHYIFDQFSWFFCWSFFLWTLGILELMHLCVDSQWFIIFSLVLFSKGFLFVCFNL